jgi:hypothetical protein
LSTLAIYAQALGKSLTLEMAKPTKKITFYTIIEFGIVLEIVNVYATADHQD